MTIPIFQINQLRRSSSFRMADSHTHHCYELYYLLKGTQKFFIRHTVHAMVPQDLAFIQPGILHRTTFSEASTHERIVILFDPIYIEALTKAFPGLVAECFDTHSCLHLSDSAHTEIMVLFQKLFVEYERKDDFSSTLISQFLCELILLLARYYRQPDAAFTTLDSGDEAIGAAAYYVSQSFHLPITLADAANVAALNPSYFSKKFKLVTGFGFKEYLTQLRLQHAAHELLHTRHSITEIAATCGFENSNYFGDLFYKANGVSPRAFRASRRP